MIGTIRLSVGCADAARRLAPRTGESPMMPLGEFRSVATVARFAHGPAGRRILWSAGVRTTRCCGLGPKRCAQSFEALRRARNASEELRVERGELSALRPYGRGCARRLLRTASSGDDQVCQQPNCQDEDCRHRQKHFCVGQSCGRRGQVPGAECDGGERE